MVASKGAMPVPLFLRTAGVAYLVAGLTLALGFFYRSKASPFMHVLTCIALVWAVIAVQSYGRAARSKTMWVGAFLLLMGTFGLWVIEALGPHVLLSSLWLSYRGLFWFFLVSFVVGSTTYSAGFYHIDATSPWAKRIFIVGLVWGVFGQIAVASLARSSAWVFSGFICWWTLALCWQGVEILTRFRYQDGISGAATLKNNPHLR